MAQMSALAASARSGHRNEEPGRARDRSILRAAAAARTCSSESSSVETPGGRSPPPRGPPPPCPLRGFAKSAERGDVLLELHPKVFLVVRARHHRITQV